jgi:hypothetical protein
MTKLSSTPKKLANPIKSKPMPLHLNDEELHEFISDLNAKQDELDAKLARIDDDACDQQQDN